MTQSTAILNAMNQRALSVALNAYCSDWEAFEDPRDALQSIAEGFGIVTVWAPLEDMPPNELCDAIECLAADIYNAMLEKF